MALRIWLVRLRSYELTPLPGMAAIVMQERIGRARQAVAGAGLLRGRGKRGNGLCPTPPQQSDASHAAACHSTDVKPAAPTSADVPPKTLRVMSQVMGPIGLDISGKVLGPRTTRRHSGTEPTHAMRRRVSSSTFRGDQQRVHSRRPSHVPACLAAGPTAASDGADRP